MFLSTSSIFYHARSTASLRRDLAILFHVNRIIGLEDGDFVVRDVSTNARIVSVDDVVLAAFVEGRSRETLDQLEFVSYLAALLGYLLLCPT